MQISPRTADALRRVADGYSVEMTDKAIIVTDDVLGCVAEIHEVDGRYVLASYSPRHAQWHSSDMPASFRRANQGFSYAYANTLRGLVDYGLRTYRSPVDAARHALKALDA